MARGRKQDQQPPEEDRWELYEQLKEPMEEARREAAEAQGQANAYVAQLKRAGIAPEALSFVNRLKKKPTAHASHIWGDVMELMAREGLSSQFDLFAAEQQEVADEALPVEAAEAGE